MTRPTQIAWIASALSLVFAGFLRTAADPETLATKRWRDGPVRYLLSDDEYARYGRLWTDEARTAFVDRFWRRLDPDPSTPKNEFRSGYEARIVEADRRFGEGLGVGWRTDRGRILLLLGEPDRVRTQPGDPQSIEREVWTYARPVARGGAPIDIVFYRGADGTYRIDPEPIDMRSADSSPASRDAEREALRLRLRRSLSGIRSTQIEHLVRGLLPPVSAFPQSSLLPSVIQAPPAGVSPRAGASGSGGGLIRDEMFFFESREGSVLTILQLTFRPPEAQGDAWDPDPTDPGFGAVAYISEASAGADEERGEIRRVDLPPRPGSGEAGKLYFAGRTFLEPGTTYEARFAVGDSLQRTLTVHTAKFEVPELGTGGLTASSVVAAESFGPLAEGKESLFAVGSEEVVPRPGGVFHRGEPLRIYLQVYGAAASPETGHQSVDVTFRFERDLGHRFKREGEPLSFRGAAGASLGLALPIGDWPEGGYRVRVELRDRVSGSRTTAEGAFRIAG